MAILYMDGFDSYATLAETVNNGLTNQGGIALRTTGGKFGGGALDVASAFSSFNCPIASGLGSGGTIGFMGWFKNESAGNTWRLFTFGPTISTGVHVIYNTATSTVDFINGAGTTIGSTSTTDASTITDGNYHHLELNVLMAGTAVGAVHFYLDGVISLTLTSVVTQSSCPGFTCGGQTTGVFRAWEGVWDDVVYWDSSGSNNNTFPKGPKRISTLNPIAAGDSTQFTPSTGANYQAVSGAYSGTWVIDTTTGKLDLYQVSDLPFAPAVIDAVIGHCYATNEGGGAAVVTPKLKTSGTTASGTTTTLPNNGVPLMITAPFATDAGGSAWTAASVNALQIGMAD